MKNNEYYREMIPELDYYLKEMDASIEEKRCARIWIRDGHSIENNDYGMEDSGIPLDFLTAIRCTQTTSGNNYTDSFYDPRTQAYIRSLNPNRTEMRKLREHIKAGGRFSEVFDEFAGETDFITYLRHKEEYHAAEFDFYFRDWIKSYGAEFLVKNRLETEFFRFLEEKKLPNRV